MGQARAGRAGRAKPSTARVETPRKRAELFKKHMLFSPFEVDSLEWIKTGDRLIKAQGVSVIRAS